MTSTTPQTDVGKSDPKVPESLLKYEPPLFLGIIYFKSINWFIIYIYI